MTCLYFRLLLLPTCKFKLSKPPLILHPSVVPGLACAMDEDRQEVPKEIAEYLNDNYSQYGRGVAYLLQLAGVYAAQRVPPPRVSFLEDGSFGVQRGAMLMRDPEPHVWHTMNVRFHRC